MAEQVRNKRSMGFLCCNANNSSWKFQTFHSYINEKLEKPAFIMRELNLETEYTSRKEDFVLRLLNCDLSM